jgi:spore coat protein CotH
MMRTICLLLLSFWSTVLSAKNLVINEIMAANKSVVADQNGEYDDWIELFNNSDQETPLKGYFLSDQFDNLVLWAFPDTTIAAYDYLTIWADEDSEQVGLHANFKLSASGETLFLVDSNAAIVDEITFGAQKEDISFGRFPDGTGTFKRMYPSFSGPNTGEDPQQVDTSTVIFGDTIVHSINLQFYTDNWVDSLKYNFEELNKSYMPVRLTFDDTLTLDSVGVRYKGNSSYTASGTTPKKSLKFKFDEYRDSQTLMGLKKLNAHNGVSDPSFMRETIAYHIARQYMPASRTAYANVYVDGNLLGLYVLVEQVDKLFLSKHFDGNNGNLYKASNNGGNLEYLGDDQSAYENDYVLKTSENKNDWSGFIDFIERLNNTADSVFIDSLQTCFDLDTCIRMLAFNMVLSNFDSYTGSSRNFYLYDDKTNGRLVTIPWDYNESFGVYTSNWDVITQDVIQISNLNDRPLNRRILAQASLQQKYLEYITDMIDGPASYDSVAAIADRLQPILEPYVLADTNKLYSNQNFLINVESSVYIGLGQLIPGIKSFSQARNANLLSQLSKVAVYPGDTDNDGKVDALDMLPIGIYFLSSGTSRDSATFAWGAQKALKWDAPAITYADANGDGIVNEKDIIGIGVNWGNTHSAMAASYEIDPQALVLSQHAQGNLNTLYKALAGNSEPIRAMKAFLESVLGKNDDDKASTILALSQSYPNPFNSEVAIEFSLPERHCVTLTIYNVLGQIVFQPIAEQYLESGRYQYNFDFAELASGVYLYRIQTEAGAIVRKMMLIK